MKEFIATQRPFIQKLVDSSPLTADESLTGRLVDRIGYRKKMKFFSDYRIIPLQKYASQANQVIYRHAAKRNMEGYSTEVINIGVVHLTGMIKRHSTTVSKALMDAAKDPSIGGIVLRVDSGGGDPLTSDQIAEVIEQIKEETKKPIVASYGATSASGGVYSSANCDRIFCNRTTITGSIGVASFRPFIPKAFLEKIGINIESIEFSESSKGSSPVGESSEFALERRKHHMDDIYTAFKQRVSKGRGIPYEQVESIAQGKIFAGDDALNVHLVDEIGRILSSL